MRATRQDHTHSGCEFGSCRLQGRFGLRAEIATDLLRETAPATGNGLVGRLGGERAVIVLERQRAGRPANENTVSGHRGPFDDVWLHHGVTGIGRRGLFVGENHFAPCPPSLLRETQAQAGEPPAKIASLAARPA